MPPPPPLLLLSSSTAVPLHDWQPQGHRRQVLELPEVTGNVPCDLLHPLPKDSGHLGEGLQLFRTPKGGLQGTTVHCCRLHNKGTDSNKDR
jgi:hypothetical protein